MDKRMLTTCLLMIVLAVNSFAQKANASRKPYIAVPAGYVMVLRQGDDIFDALEKFAKEEGIPSANFTGMGFVNVTFGYFDFNTRQYTPGEFRDVELASMHGTIAWKDKAPSIHAHGVVGDKSFNSFAGHMLKATVSTGSVEILISIHDKRFEREHDEKLGADVLNISDQ